MPDPCDDGGPAEPPEEMCGCAGRQRGGKEGQIQQVYRKRGVLRFQSCEQSSLGWVYTETERQGFVTVSDLPRKFQ